MRLAADRERWLQPENTGEPDDPPAVGLLWGQAQQVRRNSQQKRNVELYWILPRERTREAYTLQQERTRLDFGAFGLVVIVVVRQIVEGCPSLAEDAERGEHLVVESRGLYSPFIQCRGRKECSVQNLSVVQLVALSQVEEPRGRDRKVGSQVEGQPVGHAGVVGDGVLCV